MPNNTLAAHLAKARAARDPDKLRERAAQMHKLRQPHQCRGGRPATAPCTCGQADGKHKYNCPGYRRDRYKKTGQ